MSKRYSTAEKASALLRLDQNGGDIAFTALQLDIPKRTLQSWNFARAQEQQHAKNAQRALRETAQYGPSTGDNEQLRSLREQLLANATALATALTGSIEDMTPVQRATTLTQVITSIAKLNTFVPLDDDEGYDFRIIYENATTGEVSRTPPEPDDDY